MAYPSELEAQDLKWNQETKIELITYIQRLDHLPDVVKQMWEHELAFVALISYSIDTESLTPKDNLAKVHWNISLRQERANWYHDKKWVPFLGQYLLSGKITFFGPDHHIWGYEFENGKTYELIYPKLIPSRGVEYSVPKDILDLMKHRNNGNHV